MIVVYTSPGCASCRKVKQWLKDRNLPFIEKNIFKVLLNDDEIKHLLMRSETFVNNEPVEQAAALGIDLRIPHRVLAVGLLPGQPDIPLAQSYAVIAQRARQIDHTVLSCQTRTALFLLTRSQRQDSLLDFAQQLRGMTAPALPVCIGIEQSEYKHKQGDQ